MGVFHGRAIVFDKDGVLLDTMAMIRSVWAEWADERGLDSDEVLASIHMTGYELLRRFAPAADPAAEFRWIGARQARREASIAAFPGAASLLRSLPDDSWAIVTSARREVSTRHLEAAGLPVPRVLVCAEDTPRGKPHPAGYLLAAERLGVPAATCVAVEDAPAGVRAARDAGMFVVALTTTHDAGSLSEANVVVPAIDALSVALDGAGLLVTFPAEPSVGRG
jgi:mannitol-1-/sugar-/sorbitol-6-phosphatase